MDFVVGAHGAFYYSDLGGGAKYDPARVVVHPAYTGYDWYGDNSHDVAIIFLDQCVALSDKVQPIPLATAEGE
jgi:hypothetical protein